MSLQVYNTLTHQKEPFTTLTPGEVKMYVCGPTVYNYLHVGNFRGPVFFNLVRNWLEASGYKVNFVYNYTDVDDRIIERAQKDGVDCLHISETYIAAFESDYRSLNLGAHTHNPKVTEYMEPIVDIIQTLIDRKKAYVVDGEVLYSVRSFPSYGKLSRRSIDDLQSGGVSETGGKKQDPLDFSLWKKWKPGEPKWSAPWGEGRPGWHIECSAMIKALLGDSIDIHGGGTDLVFPHHENELAQSEGATEKPFVKYWMHNNMLDFGGKKMSKSLGNIKIAREFIHEYNAEILKFMLLQAHYRSLSDFSEKQIANAISGLARVYSALALAERSSQVEASGGKVHTTVATALAEAEKDAVGALNDDFNTPEFFAAIYNLIRAFNSVSKPGMKVTPDVKATAVAFRDWVLGKGRLMSLFEEPAMTYLRLLDDMLLAKMGLQRTEIDSLVTERTQARAAKDFKKGDELRDQLVAIGIALQDTPEGTQWEVQK